MGTIVDAGADDQDSLNALDVMRPRCDTTCSTTREHIRHTAEMFQAMKANISACTSCWWSEARHTATRPMLIEARDASSGASRVGPGYDKGKAERLREEVDHRYKCNFFKWASQVKKESLR